MFARTRRRKARDLFSAYLEGRLAQREAAWLELALADDAQLARELQVFEQTIHDLHSLRRPALPADFADEVALALALEAKPLRNRYSELLDGHGTSAQLAALRAEIDADPELAAEYALLEAALAEAHRFPAVALPAGFRTELRRRIDEERRREAPHYRRAPATPLLARPRLAWAAAAALFLFGLMAGDRLLGDRDAATRMAEVPSAPRPVLDDGGLMNVADAIEADQPGEIEIEVDVPANADGSTPEVEVKTGQDGSVSVKPPPGSTLRIGPRRSAPRVSRPADRPRTMNVANRRAAETRPPSRSAQPSATSPAGGSNGASADPTAPLDEAGMRTFRITVSDSNPDMPPPSALNALPPSGDPNRLVLAGVTAEGFE